jgi:hypothetical protein
MMGLTELDGFNRYPSLEVAANKDLSVLIGDSK